MTSVGTRCLSGFLLGFLTFSESAQARVSQAKGQSVGTGSFGAQIALEPLPDPASIPGRFRRMPFRYMTERRGLRLAKRYFDDHAEAETVVRFSNDDGTWTQRSSYSAFSGLARRAGSAVIVYDSATGAIRSVGSISSWGRQGRWFVLDSTGKRSTTRYRYGYHPDSLHNSSGRRLLIYYGYGFGGGGLCSTSAEQYAMAGATIGWCVVTPGMVVRAAIHNFPNDCIQTLRHGFGWKKRYLKDGCYIN